MNKRRDALRRGIRALIRDTSRDLATFAGLNTFPQGAGDGGPAHAPADSASSASSPPLAPPPAEDAGPRPLPGITPVSTGLPLPPIGVRPGAALPASDVQMPAPVQGPRQGPPAGSAAPVIPPGSTDVPPLPPRPPASLGPLPATPPVRPRALSQPSRAKQARGGQRAAGKTSKKKSARGKAHAQSSRRAGHPRRQPLEDGLLDGVHPQQVHARKGVCFAYFINKQCWRVPQAYCNTALQVCTLRECPVYHLHKDALERRFAEKYKHLW